MAAVAIAHIRAKSRHFHRRGGSFQLFARFWFLDHYHDAELCANREAIRENLFYTPGSRISSHIIISGFAVQQNVAHTSADEIGLVALGAQRPANTFRKCACVHAAIMRESRPGWKI